MSKIVILTHTLIDDPLVTVMATEDHSTLPPVTLRLSGQQTVWLSAEGMDDIVKQWLEVRTAQPVDGTGMPEIDLGTADAIAHSINVLQGGHSHWNNVPVGAQRCSGLSGTDDRCLQDMGHGGPHTFREGS